MANRDTPFGAVPLNHAGGGLVRNSEYPMASGYATSIYMGDFVKLVAAGVVERAAAGDELLGVFKGVRYKDSEGNYVIAKHWPASTTATEIYALVYDDPNTVFLMQHDSDGGNPAAADVGLMYDILATAGDSTFKESREEIDTSTGGTATAQLRQIGFYKTPDNEVGQHAKALVVINEHIYRGTDGI